MRRGHLRDGPAGNSSKVEKGRMRTQLIVSMVVLTTAIVASAYSTQSQSPPAGKPPVMQPGIDHLAKPDCGAGQTCHGIHGVVTLDVQVLTDGTVGDVDVMDEGADQRLKEAAIAAAQKCRFKPGTFKGKPTSMSYGLTYKS
jgi:TonB family protein